MQWRQGPGGPAFHFLTPKTASIGSVMTLKKSEVIERIQDQLDLPRDVSIEITETLIEIIKATLESGEDLLISGFGKFSVKEKAARKGRNPNSGHAMMLRKRRVVTFSCSKVLRDKVNGRRVAKRS